MLDFLELVGGAHCLNPVSYTHLIRLYNEALPLAGETDLSGAAANLEQSLLFDKNNIQARNLLGLIYCETGRIGDALRHWIISSSLLPEGNAAAGYMAYLQKNAREMEK